MEILLSFTGFHDPYNQAGDPSPETAGPILTVLANRSFQRIILFSTKKTQERSDLTAKAIQSLYPEITITQISLQITDPTNHLGILRQLRIELKQHAPIGIEQNYSISISSGTPHMHACWLLLVASAEFPAKLLQPLRPENIKPGKPAIQEIELTAREFPEITTSLNWDYDDPDTDKIYSTASELKIVGSSLAFENTLRKAYTLSNYSEHIMLLGETGTGKEMITQFIHSLSARSNRPLTVINCGGIPENLAESVLFGHLKGSFTGATSNQDGKFKAADKGILFLDEVGDLPLHVQTKLLRVMEQHEIEPVGSSKPIKVDVQIIAATNKDIPTMVAEGEFREDLFQRFVTTLEIPSLRERREDIPLIAKSILDHWNKDNNKQLRFTSDAINKLVTHPWLGNVRDLKNLVTRSAMFAQNDSLTPNDLQFQSPTRNDFSLPEPEDGFVMEDFIKATKNQLIEKAITMAKGNKAKAARLLGWTPSALSNHLTRQQTPS